MRTYNLFVFVTDKVSFLRQRITLHSKYVHPNNKWMSLCELSPYFSKFGPPILMKLCMMLRHNVRKVCGKFQKNTFANKKVLLIAQLPNWILTLKNGPRSGSFWRVCSKVSNFHQYFLAAISQIHLWYLCYDHYC